MPRKALIHLRIAVGLLIMGVVALMVVGSLPARRGVEVSFIRYAHDGPAVLKFTSHEEVPVRCSSRNAWLFLDMPPRAFQQSVLLMPRSQTQLLVAPYSLQESRSPRVPTNASVLCMPQSSKLRRHIESLLGKAGINIVSTGFVVSVGLPPK